MSAVACKQRARRALLSKRDAHRTRGHCFCGCGKPTNIIPSTDRQLGLIKGEFYRYIAGHQTRLAPMEYALNPLTGCWEWQRGKFRNGYGEIRHQGKTCYAHRIYYERSKGPIPAGHVIDHLCRNKACVNPAHLEAVLFHVNCWRGSKAILTKEIVQTIRHEIANGLATTKELATRYYVSEKCISNVLTGTRWGKV